MSLADYQPERQIVFYKGDKPLAEVRGLNLEDVSFLVRTYQAQIDTFYSLHGGDLEAASIGTIATKGFLTQPELCYAIIAQGAGEGIDHAKKLSAPLAIKVLGTVLSLTFEDVGGPLAFSGLVKAALVSFAQQSAMPAQP